MEKRTGRREIWAARFALSRIYHPSHPANGWPFSSPDSGHALSLSLPLSPPLWNRYSLLFLPPGRVAPPPPPLSLSLSFFLSSLPNSWFPFDEHDEERKNDEPCCRNGIGLINVGGPQIWLNSEQRWTSSRIKFLPEAYTTLSRTRSPFSRLFGSANTRIRFFRGETFQS